MAKRKSKKVEEKESPVKRPMHLKRTDPRAAKIEGDDPFWDMPDPPQPSDQ